MSNKFDDQIMQTHKDAFEKLADDPRPPMRWLVFVDDKNRIVEGIGGPGRKMFSVIDAAAYDDAVYDRDLLRAENALLIRKSEEWIDQIERLKALGQTIPTNCK